MKKAVKNFALGMTLVVSMSAAVGCAPGGADQGAGDGAGGLGQQGRGGVHTGQGTMFGTGGQVDTYDGAVQNKRGGFFGMGRQGGGLFGGQGGQGDQGGLLGHGNMGDRLGDNVRGGGPLAGGPGARMEDGRADFGGAGFQNMGPWNQQTADELEQRCVSIDGVEDAAVVFHNNVCLVGLKTEDGQQDNNLIRQVRQQLQGVARGEQVHITTDEKMVKQIEQVSDRLRDGQPMANVQAEIGQLFNQLSGQMTTPVRNK